MARKTIAMRDHVFGPFSLWLPFDFSFIPGCGVQNTLHMAIKVDRRIILIVFRGSVFSMKPNTFSFVFHEL